MNILQLFDSASSVMTGISFLTFIGIVWWAFISHKPADFDAAARLPFADDESHPSEQTHG